MMRSQHIFASALEAAHGRLIQPVRVRPAGDSAMLPKFHASNSAGQRPLGPKVSRVKFASPGACREAKFHASNFQPGAGGHPAKRGGQPMPPPK